MLAEVEAHWSIREAVSPNAFSALRVYLPMCPSVLHALPLTVAVSVSTPGVQEWKRHLSRATLVGQMVNL